MKNTNTKQLTTHQAELVLEIVEQFVPEVSTIEQLLEIGDDELAGITGTWYLFNPSDELAVAGKILSGRVTVLQS